eukprot:gene4078-6982_t
MVQWSIMWLLVLIVLGWLQWSPAINIVRADVIKQTRSRQPSLCEDSDDERLGVSKRTRSKSEDDPNDGTTGTKLYPTGILRLKDRAGVRGILASPLSDR